MPLSTMYLRRNIFYELYFETTRVVYEAQGTKKKLYIKKDKTMHIAMTWLD